MQSRRRDGTVTQCLQTDRQTWAQLCILTYTCECSICSTAKYKRGYLQLLVIGQRGLRNGDKRDSCDLSWPQVHKPECERWLTTANWPDVPLTISQSHKAQSHTSDQCLVNRTQDWKRCQTRENLCPTSPSSNISLPLSQTSVCKVSFSNGARDR